MRGLFFPLRLLTLLLFAATVPGVQLAAAQEQPDAADAQEQPAASDPEAADSSVPAADSNRPPDDYEASEQISEDLSVSFPVDI